MTQERFTIREHMESPRYFCEVRIAHLFSFALLVGACIRSCVLCPMFPVSLYCPVFIVPSSYVQCFLCLCIVQSSFPLRLMSNVSCVSVLSSLHCPFVWCPMFPVSLYCPVFIVPSSYVQCFLCLCIVQSSLPLHLMSNVSCVSVLSSLHQI